MAEQGRFTYRLDVENNRALKNITDFAKSYAKMRQRVERDIKAQVRANAELDKTIIKQRGELQKLRTQYRKDTVGKKASEEAAAKTGAEIDKLTQKLFKNREELRQGTRAIRGYQAELDKLDNAQARQRTNCSAGGLEMLPFQPPCFRNLAAVFATISVKARKLRSCLGLELSRPLLETLSD